jgi:hypothetical protein
MNSKIIFLELCRAAARVVNMGGASSSHAPFFSRAAAFEGSMTVSVVQAQGVVLAGWCPRVVLRLPRGYLGQAGGRPSKGFRAAARVV